MSTKKMVRAVVVATAAPQQQPPARNPMSVAAWVAEGVAEFGVEEVIAVLHDAYLSAEPDQEILDALASLGDTTFA